MENIDNAAMNHERRFLMIDPELIDCLSKKIKNEPVPVGEITTEVDLYMHSPEYLAETYPCLGDDEWYFFTPNYHPKPRYVEGIGFWKGNNVEQDVVSGESAITGVVKALVFYEGKPAQAKKTNWIMHEYKLKTPSSRSCYDMKRMNDWIMCRIFRKAESSDNYIKGTAVAHDNHNRAV